MPWGEPEGQEDGDWVRLRRVSLLGCGHHEEVSRLRGELFPHLVDMEGSVEGRVLCQAILNVYSTSICRHFTCITYHVHTPSYSSSVSPSVCYIVPASSLNKMS